MHSESAQSEVRSAMFLSFGSCDAIRSVMRFPEEDRRQQLAGILMRTQQQDRTCEGPQLVIKLTQAGDDLRHMA